MATQKELHQQIKEAAERDLETFIKLVHPKRLLGGVHLELINWWTRSDAKTHQLVLLPRDHMKSALIAYRVAWEITRNPAVRVLYLSSTANLAEKQLKFIKDILTSNIYRKYWPEMVNEDESKREKWTSTEISVDHPKRAEENVRDPTIFIGGLTTGLTGMHCDIAVLDDCVVKENAYTVEGRDKVKGQYSLLASIESADALEWVVGTRYFPQDLYYDLMQMEVEIYNDEGDLVAEEKIYEIFERVVEDRGDGSGQFLWPRQQRSDGVWFGFDQKILAQKKAKYLDRTQFRAQYYNDPNDVSDQAVKREYFQYYEPKYLTRQDGRWFFKGRRINVFAAIDFAFSLARKADYTCVVVVGVDTDNNYYVLDIDRFKTSEISDYFKAILRLHQKWDFRKIRMETTAAQETIVKDIKDNYIRRYGLALSVDHYKPSRHDGRKEERMEATLHPRYENRQIWHYHGGNCQILEEELVLQKPPHDDVKDCLAACIDICVPPSLMGSNVIDMSVRQRQMNNRFGGYV